MHSVLVCLDFIIFPEIFGPFDSYCCLWSRNEYPCNLGLHDLPLSEQYQIYNFCNGRMDIHQRIFYLVVGAIITTVLSMVLGYKLLVP